MKNTKQEKDTPISIFYARNLKKVYHMGEVEVTALHSVNLDLYYGEFIVLLGPSGSGKSTLLNILGGLDTPTDGFVNFAGKNLNNAGEEELTLFRRNHIGFVFQFYNLIPGLTAKENVELVTDICSDPIHADIALSLVDLTERKDHFPAQLSGGEQQRVAIARAIAKKPEVLLCDEPTGALDFKTGSMVLKAIQKVNMELQTTTVVITHNASIAEMADRIITMRDGTIVSNTMNKKKKQPEELNW